MIPNSATSTHRHLPLVLFLGWMITAIFTTANAGATSFIPPIPQVEKSAPSVAPTAVSARAEVKTLNEYWGMSYHFLTLDNPGISSTSPKMFMVDFGHHLDDSLALEARMALPTSEDTISFSGATANQKVNILFTAQLRKGVINYKGVEAYALFGVTYSNLTTAIIENATLQQTSRESTDISYGFGLRTQLGHSNFTGHIEYNRLVNLTQFGLSSLGMGVNYYF